MAGVLLQEVLEMKEFYENFSELIVLPPIDDDVDTGVEDQEEVGEVGEDGAPGEICDIMTMFGQLTINL